MGRSTIPRDKTTGPALRGKGRWNSIQGLGLSCASTPELVALSPASLASEASAGCYLLCPLHPHPPGSALAPFSPWQVPAWADRGTLPVPGPLSPVTLRQRGPV